MVAGGNVEARAILYAVFANVAGMVVCRTLESRDRELFHQRRRAEAAQAELAERARAAEEAHMEKTRLLAAVSHDLRQPMTAALTYVDLLKGRLEKADLEKARQDAERLGDSIGILNTTLDHLLTAARYDSGTEPIRIESVELAPLLLRLRETFAADAQARGIELRVRLPDRRLIVTSDLVTLWRVLMNLLSNAVKFTDSKGRAGRGGVVRASLKGSVCRIDVADTGVGIAPEHIDAIWQPYFQIANAERNRERGLGLGLFLVRRALDHLPDHRLSLRSRPGRGSRFTLSLPGSWLSDPVALVRSAHRLGSEDLAVMRGAYVFVIEDDRDARRALQELLADWGVLYSSGATLEGLLADARSSDRVPDAIISDYRLPGGNSGVDCIRQVRERLGTEVRGVIVTGEPDLDRIRRHLPEGVVVLQKPFDAAALALPLIEAVSGARHAERL
jgi:signal transduction histidine kinase